MARVPDMAFFLLMAVVACPLRAGDGDSGVRPSKPASAGTGEKAGSGPQGNISVHEQVSSLRMRSVREAALSWGIRRGMASEMRRIQEILEKNRTALSRIYNFRALLMEIPGESGSGGILLQPPVIIGGRQGVSITGGGRIAALAGQTWQIVAHARLVLGPSSWEDYLVREIKNPDEPPKSLYPADSDEEARWNESLLEGELHGIAQAREILAEDLNRLQRDFLGQIRYRDLLARGILAPPRVDEKNRGVTGNSVLLRIGDVEVRVTGDAAFERRMEKWSATPFPGEAIR